MLTMFVGLVALMLLAVPVVFAILIAMEDDPSRIVTFLFCAAFGLASIVFVALQVGRTVRPWLVAVLS